MRRVAFLTLHDPSGFVIDDELKLECFRIPHFYRAFYVYKYATGLSAAIALSERVLNGGKAELNDYLSFLKGGCSKDPLDLLKDAGVEKASLDGVILVGGSTRVPAVRAYVETIFGRAPLSDIDPDQVVALGAAVQADILAGVGRSDRTRRFRASWSTIVSECGVP